MTVEKSANSFLNYVRVVCTISGITFIVFLMVSIELGIVLAKRTLPLWLEAIFVFSAFMANICFLDLLFTGWAKIRFDMYVMSGAIRRNGAKYERGVYVRMETEEYFIPVGQELVLRNSATGNTQVLAGPDSQNAK